MTPLPSSAALVEKCKRIDSLLPQGGLFAGLSWRVAPHPFPLPETVANDLKKLGHRLWKFLRACDLLYTQSIKGTMPPWISQILDAGKPDSVIQAGRDRAFRGQLPGIIRPDIIPTPTGYILSEIDSVPGGIGLTAWMNEIYSAENDPVLGGPAGMLDGFASLFPDGGSVYVSQEAATYRPEMEWLTRRLSSSGRKNLSLVGQGEPLPSHGSLYRFFEMFDLANIPEKEALFSSAKNGRLRITAPPKAFLEEKLWFALFWLKPLETFWIRELGSGIFHALRKSIPRTWLLDPTPLPYNATIPSLDIHSWQELKSFSQKQRRLAVKISGFSELAWGARGVTLGHDVSSEHWASTIDHALNSFHSSPFILQEFHQGAIFPTSYFDPATTEILPMDARARICPYYFPDGNQILLGGALVTLCPSDKKLIHGMTDAILCPAS